jgi:hypothetical protein
MKMTRRQTKWAIWYETTYWKNGHHRIYQTHALTEYHSMLHDRAKAGGYKAETYRYERFGCWPGLAGFLIRTTK